MARTLLLVAVAALLRGLPPLDATKVFPGHRRMVNGSAEHRELPHHIEEQRFVNRLWMRTKAVRTDCTAEVPKDKLPRPMMTSAEVALLVSLMPQVTYYLEYGSGSSTEFFAPLTNFTVSIETSYSWCRDVYDRPITKCLINQGQVDLLCFALSETGAFATPTSWAAEHHLTNYHMYIRSISFINFPRYDLVLIDGRFRVAIALYILRHISNETMVAIHDFKIRPKYQKVLNYYDMVKSADTLVIFRKKPTLQHEDLLEWRQHMEEVH